jgi:hypothetical protein
MRTKIFSLLLVVVALASCKRDEVFGDTDVNTDRKIVEFSDPHGFKSMAVDYSTDLIEFDVTDVRFMIRSFVENNATVRIIVNPNVVYDYNDANGTNYAAVPATAFDLENTEFTLTPTERSLPVTIRLRPSDIANGQNAIGFSIAEVEGGEVSRIAGTLVVAIAVKNKYDGVYHLKGHFTRVDLPAYNGPFETEVEMITTGPNSVAMYWPEFGDYYQPFANNGALTAFSNVAPEIFFDANDQVSSLTNITGDPATGPFMTVVPGSNSRYENSDPPVIYLKYYYNTVPTNRIFADTLTYIGPR